MQKIAAEADQQVPGCPGNPRSYCRPTRPAFLPVIIQVLKKDLPGEAWEMVHRVGDSPDSGVEQTQLVTVFDATTGAFEGLFLGHATGRLRTGGIGGVAIDALARDDSDTLGVLGCGVQARSQVGAACAARSFADVLVYSPTPESRKSFAETVDGDVDPAVRSIDDPESVVRAADALVCATNSTEPVFDPDWLEAGTHVTTIGPRFEDAHELPLEVVARADSIATDSLPQVDAYDRPYIASGADRERMVELADALEHPELGRTDEDDITLFCSVGLAGTEPVLGKRLLEDVA